MLELKSNNKGLLIPSLTTNQRNAITLPTEGLTIYNETTKCVEFNISTDGSHDWKNACNGSGTGPIFPNPVSVSRNLENKIVNLNTK